MKLLLTSLTLAALVFTGCSQKNPEVDMTEDGTKKVTADAKIGTITTGIDAQSATSQETSVDTVKQTIGDLEEKISTVYFNFDKFDIREDMKANVETNAQILTTDETKDFSVKIEGNCDEWGTDEYNYALGLKRAKSAKDSLATFGVDKERIMIVSFGESNPTCTDKNKACWDKNRRAEFKILP